MAQTTEPPSGLRAIAVCSASDKALQHLPLGITRDATLTPRSLSLLVALLHLRKRFSVLARHFFSYYPYIPSTIAACVAAANCRRRTTLRRQVRRQVQGVGSNYPIWYSANRPSSALCGSIISYHDYHIVSLTFAKRLAETKHLSDLAEATSTASSGPTLSVRACRLLGDRRTITNRRVCYSL